MTKPTDEEYNNQIAAFKLRIAFDMKKHQNACGLRQCRRHGRCSLWDKDQEPWCLRFYTAENFSQYRSFLKFAQHVLDRVDKPGSLTPEEIEQFKSNPKDADYYLYTWFLLFTSTPTSKKFRGKCVAKAIRNRISASLAGEAN